MLPDTDERLYEAAPWLKSEKAYVRQLDRVRAWRDDAHDDDEDDNYDAISGSLRWARRSEDSLSIGKSEVEFARSPQRDEFEETTRRLSPADRESMLLCGVMSVYVRGGSHGFLNNSFDL